MDTDEPLLGLARDPWPYDYLVNGLYFFAMDERRLRAYVPRLRGPVEFDDGGVYPVESGLYGLVRAFRECIGVGRDWNSVVDPGEEDEALPPMFETLAAAADRVHAAIAPDHDRAPRPFDDRLVAALAEARLVARAILARTAWADDDPVPLVDGREMLSRWSRGLSDDLVEDPPSDPQAG